MSRQIKLFTDKSILEYDQGAFDNWCVYLTRPNLMRHAPRDIQYFSRFQQLGKKYTNQKIYNDFVEVYNKTNSLLDAEVINFITEITADYGSDGLEMDILFSIVYAGMVAEENKANTILKKRIKRLGMHQTLIEKMTADDAANFSRGKKWRELDAICKQKGF